MWPFLGENGDFSLIKEEINKWFLMYRRLLASPAMNTKLVADLCSLGYGWITSDAAFAHLQELWQEIDDSKSKTLCTSFSYFDLFTTKSREVVIWFIFWGKKPLQVLISTSQMMPPPTPPPLRFSYDSSFFFPHLHFCLCINPQAKTYSSHIILIETH